MLQLICQEFGITEQELLTKNKNNTNAQNARGAAIFILRKKGYSFGQIAKELKNPSRGAIHNEYKIVQDYYENNTYHIKEKIDKVMEQLEHTATSNLQEETEVLEETPEVVSVEQSPLSEPVIERNIDTLLRSEPKKQVSETDFLDDLDDYQAFEFEQDQQNPDTIPEVNFQAAPNDKVNEVTIQMDDETADFSTESILNMVEFGSVELAYLYAQIPEREVRDMEKEGEVPPKSTEITREANDNCRSKLEENAAKKIKLLQEPLKKVLKRRNVSVSPESALVLALLMFGFSMFMTAKSIKKDNEYFLEKLRKMNTELKTDK